MGLEAQAEGYGRAVVRGNTRGLVCFVWVSLGAGADYICCVICRHSRGDDLLGVWTLYSTSGLLGGNDYECDNIALSRVRS